jgi:phospholipid transport system substrate-binding protein
VFSFRAAPLCALVAALWLVLLPARLTAAAGVVAIDSSTPQALVQTSSQALLADLDANRAAYKRDISLLQKSIEQNFVPHFDVDYSAQQVLGKYWRDASAEQRQRFTEAFYTSMMRIYGNALLDFTAERLKILPFQGDLTASRATVRSQMRTSSGAAVAVNYTLRKLPNGDWKIWDVVIEGISYVKSFRDDYGVAVQQQGLDALIARLEAQAASKEPVALPGAPKGK